MFAAPLTDLTIPKQPWTWGADQDCTFDQLREVLCNPSVLRLLKFELPFVIDADAYCDATSTVLLKQYNNGLPPIACHSCKYTLAEPTMVGERKNCWPYTSRV